MPSKAVRSSSHPPGKALEGVGKDQRPGQPQDDRVPLLQALIIRQRLATEEANVDVDGSGAVTRNPWFPHPDGRRSHGARPAREPQVRAPGPPRPIVTWSAPARPRSPSVLRTEQAVSAVAMPNRILSRWLMTTASGPARAPALVPRAPTRHSPIGANAFCTLQIGDRDVSVWTWERGAG